MFGERLWTVVRFLKTGEPVESGTNTVVREPCPDRHANKCVNLESGTQISHLYLHVNNSRNTALSMGRKVS